MKRTAAGNRCLRSAALQGSLLWPRRQDLMNLRVPPPGRTTSMMAVVMAVVVVVMIDAHCQQPMLAMAAVALAVFVGAVRMWMAAAIGSETARRASSRVLLVRRRTA